VSEIYRSNLEAAKRVFLDRLTTDAQPLLQPDHIDEGPGDEYDYTGVGDSANFGVGFDCSGLCGVVLGIALHGFGYFAGRGYVRLFSTETFPGPLEGFRRVSQAEMLADDYPLKVAIMHGGGGPNSHMACMIDGWHMESNGEAGVCTEPPQITPLDSDYWNDFLVHDGPIIEDTKWRQPMGYPQGLDYAGGRIAGADLASAGYSFVCRYLTDGGPGLPGKQLLPDEFADLVANGIAVVFNWETTADRMLGDTAAGMADAQAALAYIRSLPGVAPDYQPVVYFSCDWDEAPDQQGAVNDYLTGAGSVLGGPQFVGIYGGYWPLSRALDAGVCNWAWQTEAWSGGNIDARVNIVQRNNAGYAYIAGVQCDINEAHTDYFGQYTGDAPMPVQPTPAPAANPPAIPVPADQADQVKDVWAQLLTRWDMLNGRTPIEAIAEIGQKLGLPYHPPGG
jgi:hypothetical protein